MKFSPAVTCVASLLASAGSGKVGLVVSAEVPLPPEPSLAGQSFKITIIENLEYLVKVNKKDDGNPTKDQITGYMKDMIESVAQKAGFDYELFLPSGYGPSCVDGITANSTDAVPYAKKYRSQFNCGQEDVLETDRAVARTDMYWSLYYVSTPRQRWNQFTIPYKPPGEGALTMYGTATEVADVNDMIAQQAAGTQKPVCLGSSTAYGAYLQAALPDLQFYETPNTNAGFLEGIRGGHCEAIVNAYPYATDFIAERYDMGECEVDGKPIGVIGSSLGFGLSQFAVGVSREQPVAVTEAISYWLNVLMTCAPGDAEGACPEGSGLSLFEQYSSYGRNDPAKCGYVQYPVEGGNKIGNGAIAGIVVGCVALLAVVFFAVMHAKRKAEKQRIRERFVKQVSRNITIGDSPNTLSAEKLAKEIDHIGSGNGKITKAELKAWLQDDKLGKVAEKDFELLWAAMDADNSGEVDAVEFCVYLSCCGKEFEKVHGEQATMTKSQKVQFASQRISLTKGELEVLEEQEEKDE